MNPPVVDVNGLFAIYDVLGTSLATGKLAADLGIEGGADLVQSVRDFVAWSPTLAGVEGDPVETAGALSVIGAATRNSSRAWAKVEQAAAAAWRKPGSILSVGLAGAAVIATFRFFDVREKTELERIASQKSITSEALLRVSPEEALAYLKTQNYLGESASDWGWLKWAGLVVAGLVAWQVVKAVR